MEEVDMQDNMGIADKFRDGDGRRMIAAAEIQENIDCNIWTTTVMDIDALWKRKMTTRSILLTV